MNQAALNLLNTLRNISTALAAQYNTYPVLQAVPTLQAAHTAFTGDQDIEAAPAIDLQSTDEVYLQEFRRHLAYIASFAAVSRFGQSTDLKAQYIVLLRSMSSFLRENLDEALNRQIRTQFNAKRSDLLAIKRALGITPAELNVLSGEIAIFTAAFALEEDGQDDGCSPITPCGQEDEARNGCVGSHPIATVISALSGAIFGAMSIVFTSAYIKNEQPEERQDNKEIAISQGVFSLICLTFAFRNPIKNAVVSTYNNFCGFGSYQGPQARAATESSSLLPEATRVPYASSPSSVN